MDTRFAPHNSHHEDPGYFSERDPQLGLLARQPLVHEPGLLEKLPSSVPGIYTVGGGRQVGKTTLVKMWMRRLIESRVPARSIAYMSGEMIDDHHTLVRLLGECIEGIPGGGTRFIALDEVTYIRDWDRALKHAADSGLLSNTVMLVTGSDLGMIRDARRRFPGRRGRADVVDFHLFPLSFREAALLKRGRALGSLATADRDPSPAELAVLDEEMEAYLVHGGYLTAMNDMARTGRISPSTLATYSDWVRGDFLKRGKREAYLREVVGAVTRRMGSQVTWHALAKDMSIDHHATVIDYTELLAYMDVILVLPALREDRLSGAPKKARKIAVRDPFIFHALRSWLMGARDPYAEIVMPFVEDPASASRLVESSVASHFARLHPTFYIKGEGEVDVAYVSGRKIWPVEVKWSGRVDARDLRQIRRHGNGRILARVQAAGTMEGVPVEPLALALFRLPPPD